MQSINGIIYLFELQLTMKESFQVINTSKVKYSRDKIRFSRVQNIGLKSFKLVTSLCRISVIVVGIL